MESELHSLSIQNTESKELEAIRTSYKKNGASKVYYASIGSLPVLSESASVLSHVVDANQSIFTSSAAPLGGSSEKEAALKDLVPYPEYLRCPLVNKPLFCHLIVGNVS